VANELGSSQAESEVLRAEELWPLRRHYRLFVGTEVPVKTGIIEGYSPVGVDGWLKVLSLESGCLGVQSKVGRMLVLTINTSGRPIANKYREGKLQRTLKRELKVPEIVVGEPARPFSQTRCWFTWSAVSVGGDQLVLRCHCSCWLDAVTGAFRQWVLDVGELRVRKQRQRYSGNRGVGFVMARGNLREKGDAARRGDLALLAWQRWRQFTVSADCWVFKRW